MALKGMEYPSTTRRRGNGAPRDYQWAPERRQLLPDGTIVNNVALKPCRAYGES